MATTNNLGSNTTAKVAKIFAAKFKSSVVMAKTINTQVIQGMHDASTGDTVYLKRPHQYNAISTAAGDISSSTKSNIQSGKISATVQNYITVAMEYGEKEQSLQLDQLAEIIEPAAETVVLSLEKKIQQFAVENLGLTYGSMGTVVDAWGDIAGCGSLMTALGVPEDGNRYYLNSPFTTQLLADAQHGLYAADSLVKTAWDKAQLNKRFAGMLQLQSNSLSSWTTGASADRIGAVKTAPTMTYVGAKDTMTQTLSVTGFTNAGTIEEGDVIEYSDIYHVNPKNGQTVRGLDGSPIKFRQTVVTGVTLDGSAEGSITVTPAAIYEATGQYNNISAAIVTNVITLQGATATTYQPNMFYHKDALALGTLKLAKLYSTDTIINIEDSFSIRVSKYADGDKNLQKIRFDLLPSFAVLNPMFGGKSFGV